MQDSIIASEVPMKRLWHAITTDPSLKYDAILLAPFVLAMITLYNIGLLR